MEEQSKEEADNRRKKGSGLLRNVGVFCIFLFHFCLLIYEFYWRLMAINKWAKSAAAVPFLFTAEALCTG